MIDHVQARLTGHADNLIEPASALGPSPCRDAALGTEFLLGSEPVSERRLRRCGDALSPLVEARAVSLVLLPRALASRDTLRCPVTDKSARSTPSDLRGPFQVAKMWLLL
jgi:hypothetical protein